ncbi:MAG TPA: hypothetical protein VF412_01510 [Bdellovibrio sp.]|uniref:hypothetical protein n=1 Tax=Bdellovibrio sp. TaxID=28201 RepID=UPI002EFA0F70
MSGTNLEETLIPLLKEYKVNPNSPLPYYKQLESIQLVELIIRLEQVFQIEITALDYKPEHFTNNSTILNLIQGLKLKES